jgi:hypothetical protein
MWTETPGSVAESYLKEGKREFNDGNMLDSRPSERTWDVRLKYRYRVDGHDFAGDVKALRQPEKDNRWYEAKAVMESYRVGDALPVFYNPAKQSASRLTLKEPGIEFGKDVSSILMFLSLGTGALFLGRKILRAYQPTAPS